MFIHGMFSCGTLSCLVLINAFLRFMPIRFRGVRVGRGTWIKSRFSIGYGTGVGNCCVVRGAGSLKVGRYSAIGESVRFITSNHDTDRLSMNYLVQDALAGKRFVSEKNDVIVGNDVWIGDGVIVLPGVVIGDGAVVGAGSVVTKSVEAYTIVAGNPARVLRKRFSPELTERISNLAWWNWEKEKLQSNSFLFSLKCSESLNKFDQSD